MGYRKTTEPGFPSTVLEKDEGSPPLKHSRDRRVRDTYVLVQPLWLGLPTV